MPSIRDKIRVLSLFSKYNLAVAGTTWSYIDLDVPEAEGWGPYVDAITAHTLTSDVSSSNLQWKIVFFWSIDGRTWEGPFDLFSAISANGSDIQSDYNTKTELGLKMRYALAGRSSAATSEKAVVSCALAFSFRS